MAKRQQTVRVRIFVVTDEAGNFQASGWTGADGGDRDGALDCFEPKGRERESWVEADVPLPEPAGVVTGNVVADAG